MTSPTPTPPGDLPPLPTRDSSPAPIETVARVAPALPPTAGFGGLVDTEKLKREEAAKTEAPADPPEWHTPLSRSERATLKTSTTVSLDKRALATISPLERQLADGTYRTTIGLPPTIGAVSTVTADTYDTLGALPFDLPHLNLTMRTFVLSTQTVMGIPWDATLVRTDKPLVGLKRPHNPDQVDLVRWMFEAYTGALFDKFGNEPHTPVDYEICERFETVRPDRTVVPWTPSTTTAEAPDTLSNTSEAAPEEDRETEVSGKPTPRFRPNGEVYLPRIVRTGRSARNPMYDVELLDQAYRGRIPTLLFGPPGTGKTAMCEASLTNLVTLSGTGDTETADFVGGFVQLEDRSFKWVDGPLIVAMVEGRPLLVDEIAQIDPRALTVLYSVMDGRGELTVPANPALGTIKAQDGFYVIGACNPDSYGSVMSDALLSRFTLQVEVTTDYETLSALGVDAEIIVVAQNLSNRVAARELSRAPQTRELLGYQKLKNTFGQDLALANLIASAAPQDRAGYIATIEPTFNVKIAALRV